MGAAKRRAQTPGGARDGAQPHAWRHERTSLQLTTTACENAADTPITLMTTPCAWTSMPYARSAINGKTALKVAEGNDDNNLPVRSDGTRGVRHTRAKAAAIEAELAPTLPCLLVPSFCCVSALLPAGAEGAS